MNPLLAKQQKVDVSSLSEEEQKLFRLYGKLPTKKKGPLAGPQDRKYFDSGDYNMAKAGKKPETEIGTAIPQPENIPHASPPTQQHTNPLSPSTSPGATHSLPTASGTSPPTNVEGGPRPIDIGPPAVANTSSSITSATGGGGGLLDPLNNNNTSNSSTDPTTSFSTDPTSNGGGAQILTLSNNDQQGLLRASPSSPLKGSSLSAEIGDEMDEDEVTPGQTA